MDVEKDTGTVFWGEGLETVLVGSCRVGAQGVTPRPVVERPAELTRAPAGRIGCPNRARSHTMFRPGETLF